MDLTKLNFDFPEGYDDIEHFYEEIFQVGDWISWYDLHVMNGIQDLDDDGEVLPEFIETRDKYFDDLVKTYSKDINIFLQDLEFWLNGEK